MNIAEKSLLRKICAIILIIALTISDFLFVGQTVVSYAIDAIQTNSSNVEFSAYFLNSDGEKAVKSEKEIGEEEFLYLDISVKNEGYFTGIVTLENNNFNIKQSLSNGISAISGNEVQLNKITAGSTVTIKLAIEAIEDSIINKNYLSSETKVKLGGEYVNSKNVERNKNVTINGEAKINLSWISGNDLKNELDTSVLTNGIYNINEEEKRIVQILVKNNVTNNGYPVKNAEVTLSVSENPENTYVHTRSTDATNSLIQFTQERNCQINEGSVKISLANEDENAISWNKDSKDIIVVTYIFDKNIDVTKLNFSANSIIETYDDKKLSSEEKNVHVEENIDGIVSYNITTEEDYIYKGKLYTGEEREYKEKVTLDVDFLNIVDNISLNLNASKYVAENLEENANIIYKETKIGKNEFMTLFGEEGHITIKDENKNVVANITKDTEDEDGYFVVKYVNNTTKSIEIETSNPIVIDKLDVENVKVILNTEYAREKINELNSIKESISAKYNDNEYKNVEKSIVLRNTTSEASLEVSPTILYATEKNENIEFRVILHNNNEKYDLFKNPIIKITLPNQVEKVDTSSDRVRFLYGNGLEIKEAKKYKNEDGKFVLEINMEGTQNSYNDESIEGTTLILNADIELNKLAVNSNDEIKLNYTNEFASSYKDKGEQSAKVKIVSENRVITTNNIKELNIETSGEEENKQIYLNQESMPKDAAIDINIINNEISAISDVKILGRFPTKEADNLGLTLSNAIELNSTAKNVKIYYSDKENATSNLQETTNNWSEEGRTSSKSYLIVANNMAIGENINAKYKVNLPENLRNNLNAEESYNVEYKINSTGENKTVNATNIKLSTGTGAEIEGTLKAYVGGEEIKSGDTVYTGEIIKYELTLKNTGSESAKNVNIEAIIPEGASVVQYEKSSENSDMDDMEEGALPGIVDYYKDIEMANNKISTNIDLIDIDKEKTMNYEVRLNKNMQNSEVESYLNISYLANEQTQKTRNTETNKISNKLSKADVEMNIFLTSRPEEIKLNDSMELEYKLKISNISERNLSNVEIKILNKGFKYFGAYYMEDVSDEESIKEFEDSTFKIESLKKGETKNIYIVVETNKDNKNATISAVANNSYRSNIITEEIINKNPHVSISLNSPTNGETIENGDKIIYSIAIKNDGNVPINMMDIHQNLATCLNILNVTINGKKIDYYSIYGIKDNEEDESEKDSSIEINDNFIIGYNYNDTLDVGKSIEMVIETATDAEAIHANNIQLTSTASVEIVEMIAKSEQINHILKARVLSGVSENQNNNGNEENGNSNNGENNESKQNDENNKENNAKIDNNSGGNDKENNNKVVDKENETNESNDNNNTEDTEKTYSISGMAWLDENEDGERNSEEKALDGIKVKLLNVKDKSITEGVETKNGSYIISNLQNGKYIALYEFDNEKYMLTQYKAKDVDETKNSDVENGTIKLNGKKQEICSTDYIEINGKNLTNIDIGLLEVKKFDLALTKTISKITISNNAGTVVKEYKDASLAKAEIKSKYINGSTIVIEYTIKVKNEGELAGYVKQITDYKPRDLSFNSSLNKDWYQSGDNVYSSSLANTKIEPGETKELTLILTKTMTETNTGLTNNTAEITEVFNSRGIADIDSVPGNKNTTEDDLAQANVIISVSTGSAIRYVSISLTIIGTIAVCAYFIAKRILKDSIKF